MISIKNYWMKYQDQSAVIFANGPSLLKFIEQINEDRLPQEMFDAKWFGINYSFEKFPRGHKDLDFVFVQEWETYNIIKKVVPLDKLIIPRDPGLNKFASSDRVVVKGNNRSIGFDLQDPLKNRRQDLPNKYYGINLDTKFFSYTTTTQPAMHMCCYMGFKKIFLVGVDYRTYPGGKVHYESKHDARYTEQKLNALNRMKEGDDFLIPQLQKTNGVSIVNIGKVL